MPATIITIQPALGADGQPLVVRDPVTMIPLKAEGEPKERNSHWIRRIKAGDVLIVPAAKTAAKTAASAAKE